MQPFQYANGLTLVHENYQCEGEYCVIHNPSPHAMIEEPMILCTDTSTARLCRHGQLHQDPDSKAYFDRQGLTCMDFGCEDNFCCGCCAKLEKMEV